MMIARPNTKIDMPSAFVRAADARHGEHGVPGRDHQAADDHRACVPSRRSAIHPPTIGVR
jgi:hypothetical protein